MRNMAPPWREFPGEGANGFDLINEHRPGEFRQGFFCVPGGTAALGLRF